MKDLTTQLFTFPEGGRSIHATSCLQAKRMAPAAFKAGYSTKFLSLLALCMVMFTLHSKATALTPVISAVTPGRAAPGTTVTITGSDFNSAASSNIVFFGAARANVISGSSTSLTVTVPVGATYAPVSVNPGLGAGRTGYSPQPFQPTFNNSGYVTSVVNFDTTRLAYVSGNPSAVALGDINGDGKLDMVVTSFTTRRMLVYRNNAISGSLDSGSFASPLSITSDTGAYSLAIGDIDGDGKPDIVATSNADTGITIYRNTSTVGSITFASPVFIATPSTFTNGVVIVDIDGDGRPEIAVQTQYSFVLVFPNTSSIGSLSFGPAAFFDVTGTGFGFGSAGSYLAAGDIDGDGKPDLAAEDYSRNQVVVLRNTSSSGTISFDTKMPFDVGTAPTNLAIGDLNGDGKPELVTTNQGTSFSDTGSVSVLKNTSSGGSVSFAPALTFQTGTSPTSVSIASIAGNAQPDLVVTAANSYILSVLRNTTSGGAISFDTISHMFYSGQQSFTAAIGDMDGDGKPDVAVTNYIGYPTANIALLRNNALALVTATARTCASGMDSSIAPTTHGGLWSSSDSSVAIAYTGIYNAKAYVMGIAAGTARLTYTVPGGYTTTTVTVDAGPPSAGAISGASSVNAGANITLTDAVGGGIWAASNGNATVAAGVVHGVAAGTVTISYTVTNGCGWDYATKTITVNVGSPVTVAAITGSFFYLCVGATAPFADATAGGTWSINSGDAAVASISATGVVTGIGAGIARISYTVGSSYATKTVTVYGTPAAITGNAKLCQGATTALSDITPGGVWSSAVPSTATVGTGGIVTTVNSGTVTIYYTTSSAGCKASKVITINANPANITGPNKVCTGATIALTDATAGGTWAGTNSSANIDGSGNVTGLMAGTILVTYTAATSCFKTYNVNVNASPAAILGNLAVCTGKVTSISDPSTPGVSWTSSTPAVATISASGAVTGVSAGTTRVTYTHSNLCIATAVVSVNTTPTVSAISGPSSVSRGGAGITFSDATTGGVWTSSNAAILRVGSSTGLVTALVSAGSANINYIVTTSAGCSNFATKVVSASPAPRGYGGTTTTTVGATISVADEAMGGEWASSDNTVATVDETGMVTALAAGNADIIHTVAGSAGNTDATITSIVVNPVLMAVTLMPNPNNGRFALKGIVGSQKDVELSYQITDMLGQVVHTGKIIAIGGVANQQVALSNELANGMYLLNVKNGGERAVFHFLIEK